MNELSKYEEKKGSANKIFQNFISTNFENPLKYKDNILTLETEVYLKTTESGNELLNIIVSYKTVLNKEKKEIKLIFTSGNIIKNFDILTNMSLNEKETFELITELKQKEELKDLEKLNHLRILLKENKELKKKINKNNSSNSIKQEQNKNNYELLNKEITYITEEQIELFLKDLNSKVLANELNEELSFITVRKEDFLDNAEKITFRQKTVNFYHNTKDFIIMLNNKCAVDLERFKKEYKETIIYNGKIVKTIEDLSDFSDVIKEKDPHWIYRYYDADKLELIKSIKEKNNVK